MARRGHDVRVAEKSDAITEVGAGIQISPNGAAVLKALGLTEALENASIRADAVRLIDGPTGREVLALDLKQHAPDLGWYFIHRARLIDLLLGGAKAAGARVEVGETIDPPPSGRALNRGCARGLTRRRSRSSPVRSRGGRSFRVRQIPSSKCIWDPGGIS